MLPCLGGYWFFDRTFAVPVGQITRTVRTIATRPDA